MDNLQGLTRTLQGFYNDIQGFSNAQVSTYTMLHNKRMAFDGAHFYTSYNKEILKYDMTVAEVDSVTMTNPAGIGTGATARDIIFDGTHIYVASTPGTPSNFTVALQKYDTDLNLVQSMRVKRQSGTGTQLWPFATTPVQITSDDDNIYILLNDVFLPFGDWYIDVIPKDFSGVTSTFVVPAGSGAVDHYDGELYVAFGSSIKVYSTAGVFDRNITGVNLSQGSFIDATGIYTAGYTGVYIFDSSEVFVEKKPNATNVYDCTVDGGDLWYISGTSALYKVTI
jgi:hypothetical protein